MIDVVLKRVYHKGHLCFTLPDDAFVLATIKKLLTTCQTKDDDYVRVTLRRPQRARTTGAYSQNHHLNGHIMQICAETGNDYEAVKNAVKMIAVEQMGYPYTDFHGVITPKSESETDTAECAKLIEAVHVLAADLGIVLREE
ncbi:hypothetical protein [Treponema lecithinolyticum]